MSLLLLIPEMRYLKFKLLPNCWNTFIIHSMLSLSLSRIIYFCILIVHHLLYLWYVSTLDNYYIDCTYNVIWVCSLQIENSYISTHNDSRVINNLVLLLFISIAKTFQVSNGTIEPLHHKMQTFRQRFGERALYIGITALPVGIILLLIIIAYLCGKIKSEWRRKQREEHYSRMRYVWQLMKD